MQRELHRLRVVGDELDADVAVLGRPACGDAADQLRLEVRELAQPASAPPRADRAASPRARRRRTARGARRAPPRSRRRPGSAVRSGSSSWRAALRFASDQSAMPCSAMSRAARSAMRARSCVASRDSALRTAGRSARCGVDARHDQNSWSRTSRDGAAPGIVAGASASCDIRGVNSARNQSEIAARVVAQPGLGVDAQRHDARRQARTSSRARLSARAACR